MSYSCGWCRTPMTLPPSLASLQSRFPDLAVATDVNRHKPCCKRCDEMRLLNSIGDIECPPPDYVNVIAKVEREIQRAEQLLAQGIQVPPLTTRLSSLRLKRAQMIAERDRNILLVQLAFWAVWGKLEAHDEV
ncbi:MAG: hypothetical protein M1818_003094 [Claussenomyces sp. TS43310]|nr:MAG: hypothetical protein M1818_003094 [Claussenomyces sp. TS43310]